VNPDLGSQELKHIVVHSQAALIIHGAEHRGRDLGAELSAVAAGVRAVMGFAELARRGAAGTATALPEVDPGRPAMLQYTSGTTGEPKGVLLSHRAMVNNARFTMQAVDAAQGSVCLSPLPMFHTAGAVTCTLGPLWLAGTMILVRRPSTGLILDALTTERPQIFFHVPALLADVLERAANSGTALPRVPVLMGGASHVSPALVEAAQAAFRGTIHNLYGQTELSSVLTIVEPGASPDDFANSVGRPLPHAECRIADPATGQTLPVGVPGEIQARGYQTFLEYLDDPDATAATKDPENWVRTGDLGSMDAHGTLRVTGRIKDIIIRGGENISPIEVEEVLSSHPAVAAVAVLGLPDERLGETVAALVQPLPDTDPRQVKTELLALAEANLAGFKTPSTWFTTNALPRTAAGKIQRSRLPHLIQTGQATPMP
jgi:fatty-acyl-CoA synthase/long-chain acyl-CoA synthetase